MKMLTLTPELLRLAYKFLSECPPFSGWNLPDSSEVIFRVTRSKTTSGHYKKWSTGEHEIGISARCVGSIANLFSVMAHEMIHLYQNVTKPCTETPGVQHNAVFRRLADRVCHALHFDRLMFADSD